MSAITREMRDRYLGEANVKGLHPVRRARLRYLAMLICEHKLDPERVCENCNGTAEAIKHQDDHLKIIAKLIAMDADVSKSAK